MAQNHKQAEIAARRQRGIELRKAGKSWEEIAIELGHDSAATAFNDVKRARDANRNSLKETVEDERATDLGRLDAMLATAWKVMENDHLALSGGNVVMVGPEGEERPLHDDGPKLDAIRTLLRVLERRAKLLGSDAPTRIEAEGELKVIVEGVNVEEMK